MPYFVNSSKKGIDSSKLSQEDKRSSSLIDNHIKPCNLNRKLKFSHSGFNPPVQFVNNNSRKFLVIKKQKFKKKTIPLSYITNTLHTWSTINIAKSLNIVFKSPIDRTICEISSSRCLTTCSFSSTICNCAVVKPCNQTQLLL